MKKVTKVNTEAIDSKELVIALDELEKEKGIQKQYLLESIETALVTAYKRNFDSVENVKVTMDIITGEIHVYAEKDVVEIVENPQLEINLEDAQKISKKLAIGDKAEVELVPRNFGRIAAQTAKQVIVQKIREASRGILFDEFFERKGEIVTGIVQKADGGMVVLDLGKLEGVMPMKEQVPTENYRVNDKIRTYILDVEKGLKGAPQVTISRACTDFVRKLFELEIPEIYEGVIDIKSVSRDPGSRSKIAVYSPNENIDPVGSCVGQKGIRIQNIINELNGEKIDVIEWNEDSSIFISAALLPAQVMAVDIKEAERFAQVIVPDDQLSLAIGKAGQNARLAAKLTGWKIDIKSESQFRELMIKKQQEMEEAQNQVIEEEKLEETEEIVKPKRAKKTTKTEKEEETEIAKPKRAKKSTKIEEVEENKEQEETEIAKPKRAKKSTKIEEVEENKEQKEETEITKPKRTKKVAKTEENVEEIKPKKERKSTKKVSEE